MEPWVIDANDMNAGDILGFKSNLLHPNREIYEFLESRGSGATIIVAPKGYGKTLLLKAKRLGFDKSDTKIIPSDSLIDKPSGSPSVLLSSEYDTLRDTETYWRTLWLYSFTLAILKVLHYSTIENLSTVTTSLIKAERLRNPCDIFDSVISAEYSSYHAMVEDYNRVLLPEFRSINSSFSVFVDNVDEYYESLLREALKNEGRTSLGYIKSDYWYLAQIGLATAARELNHINNHVRIYVTMRREVLQKATMQNFFGLQMRGKSLIIQYSSSDLIEIITKNILAEKRVNLVDFRNKDKIAAFFGSTRRVTHPLTGDEEDVIEFWLRHTLGRPRDIMAIGKKLSVLAPKDRTERKTRETVRAAAKEVIIAYLGEMEPHLDGFDPALIYKLLPSNVLSAQDLEKIAKLYSEEYVKRHNNMGVHTDHIFCAFFKIGLLGYVGRDVEANEDRQIFRLPGQDSLDAIEILPAASLYLIHPAMDDVIAEKNPEYLRNLHSFNIVGQGRKWRSERSVSYVLKGDVAGSSEVTRDTEAHRQFQNFISQALIRTCGHLDYKKFEEGDAVTLIDRHPVKVVQAARALDAELRISEFRKNFRFGGDAGYIVVEGSGGTATASGRSIRDASRLVKFCNPGALIVSGHFIREFNSLFSETKPLSFSELGPSDIPSALYRDGFFDVAKSGESEPTQMQIYAFTEYGDT